MNKTIFCHSSVAKVYEYTCLACNKSFSTKSKEVDSQGWYDMDINSLTMICSIKCLASKRKKHKFNAVRTECDGIKFDSKAEKSYYLKLKTLQKNGEVIFFLPQVPLRLPGNTKYVVDFQVFYADGTVSFVDVKGVETAMFKMKKKQVEEIYPIKIEVVQC